MTFEGKLSFFLIKDGRYYWPSPVSPYPLLPTSNEVFTYETVTTILTTMKQQAWGLKGAP